MATHEPDEPISSISVLVHTAAVSDASTDSDIFVELFDWPEGVVLPFRCQVEIDTSGHNDFEGGETWSYSLPKWYFAGRIVNDIRRVCLYKGDDWGTDWGFGWISVKVNGRELWTSPGFGTETANWLSDGETWCGSYPPIEFVAPSIESLGLPDANSNSAYAFTFKARGGRKKLSWELVSGSGDAFVGKPTISASNADGTEALFSGKTIATSTSASWMGKIRVTDAEGRSSEKNVDMRVVYALPAPTIASFSPSFGWPALVPSEPTPVVVTVNSKAKDFDSRSPQATRVFFTGDSGSVEGQLVPGELTSSQVRVRVPNGAKPGPIRVQTAFGAATSGTGFTAHPNGYRFMSGFSFPNTCEDDDDSDGFPNTFDWLRFEQAFGLDEMWLMAFDQAIVPNPIATHFYITVHDLIGNGCCHGFALSALQMAKGIIPNATLPHDDRKYPLDDSLWALSGPDRPSGVLSNLIQNRQLVVWSDEALAYFLDRIDSIPNVSGALCQMNANTALDDFQSALGKGLANPRMLAFAADCALWRGHVVVPYAIEKTANTTDFRFYDPNKPARAGKTDDGGSRLWVKGSGEWGHTWSDGEWWNGVYIFTIPLTEYGHQLDWSIPGLSSLLELVGTFILGCAGTAGSGEIVQIADGQGKSLLDESRQLRTDRSQWPASARLAPIMGEGGRRRPLVVVTGKDALEFTVRSRPVRPPGVAEPATFVFVRGAEQAIGVEELSNAHTVKLDPGTCGVDLVPLAGQSNAIVRWSRRLRDTREIFSYAIRLRGLDGSSGPVRVEPTPDGRGVIVQPGARDLTFDVEVTHIDRIGQQRILEHGSIVAPAGSVSNFRVPDPLELERPGATPLVRVFDPDGSGQAVREERLAARPAGPVVIAPHRVVTRPPISVGGKNPLTVEVAARIDLSRSFAPPGSTLRYKTLDGIASSQEGNLLVVRLRAGMHPLRIVAEDVQGNRSFPRTVYVSVPKPQQRVVPPRTLFGEDLRIEPGNTGSIPIGAFVLELPTSKVTAELTLRERYSGFGRERARLEGTVQASPELAAAGAKVTSSATPDGLALKFEISWDPDKPRSGRLDLGTVTVSVPGSVTLGSSFMLRGRASAIQRLGAQETVAPLNVLPTLVKVWGGAEPSAIQIRCAQAVAEDQQMGAELALEGVPSPARNVGWWVESLSGVASLRMDAADPARVLLKGRRAGLVRLCAVAGTKSATTIVKVSPTVRTDAIQLLRRFRFLRRAGLDLNGWRPIHPTTKD